ncbi:MAG: hypothetical protein QM765_43715 [Myxococcales bacterium]
MLLPALMLTALLAAAPADPKAALAALQAYGDVPTCEAKEVIVKLPPRPPMERDGVRISYPSHSHERRPVEKQPRLAGKSGALLPYLENPDRRVARRALDLLCACPDPAATQAVLAFATRNACHPFARVAPGGVEAFESGARLWEAPDRRSCEGVREEPGFGERIVGSPEAWKRWASPESQALAAKLDAGDRAAMAAALAALDLLDLERVRTAMAGIAAVRTPLGWATVARAFPCGSASRPTETIWTSAPTLRRRSSRTWRTP